VIAPHKFRQAARIAKMWLSFCRGVVDLRCRKIFTTPKDRRTPDYFMAGLGKKLKSLERLQIG